MSTHSTRRTLVSRLKLRQLDVFLEIFDSKSLHGAAEQLHATEPALSKTLRELETFLETRLFIRSKQGMQPTAAGREFERYARQAVEMLAAGTVAAKSDLRTHPTTLRVAATPIASSVFLQPAITAFVRRFPQSLIEVQVQRLTEDLDALRKHDVDIVLGRLPPSAAMAGLVFEQLAIHEYVFVTRKGHPLARRKALDMKALTAYPLVMPSKQTMVWHEVQRLFVAGGLQFHEGLVEVVDLELSHALAARGNAVWLASLNYLQASGHLDGLSILALDTSILRAPLGLIVRSGTESEPAAAYFCELIRKGAAS